MKFYKINLVLIILFLHFNKSYCQEQTLYVKKVEELSYQFFKNLGVSQFEVDSAKKTNNKEILIAYVKQLCTTKSGIEKYTLAMLTLKNELEKAELLKNEFERKKTENINVKAKELEDFDKSDYSIISKNIKIAFEKWLSKSEFEKENDYLQRLNDKSQTSFENICNLSIRSAIKQKINVSSKPELQIENYNAENEYFNVKIKLFNVEIKDTLNIKISIAEKFKNNQYQNNTISISDNISNWIISNNNLFPKELLFTTNDNNYSKNIQNNLQNVKLLNFNTEGLAIITSQNIEFSNDKFQLQNQSNNSLMNSNIDLKPQYPGGLKNLYKFIEKNYKLPKERGLQGKLMMQFTVEEDGSLNNIKILRDVGNGCGAEAIRVIKMMPKWIPGEQNGIKIPVTYNLPMSIVGKD